MAKKSVRFKSRDHYLGEQNDCAIQVALPESLKVAFQKWTQKKKISMSAQVVKLILEKLK
tara:strand:+ start:1627 stop:1806 length:180 start_codon:yes stop_codon:yes gene_type:complete